MAADQVNGQRPQLLRKLADVEDDKRLVQRHVRATREDARPERAGTRNVAPQPDRESGRQIVALHLVEHRVKVRQQRRRRFRVSKGPR